MNDDRIPESVPTPSWAADADRVDLSYEQYEVTTERIGVGNTAEVHAATVELHGESHRVALKEPKLATGTIERGVLRAISDEADTWNRVSGHPHIVDVLDWGVNEAPWIAVEYMDGGTLADRRSEIGVEQALWIGERLADALYHAVRASTAHLDITPGNVLFRTTPEGVWDVPKIADWGVARELIARSEPVDALTPQYAAPEQFDPEAFPSPDERTDVYQVGAILYELLTGRPPFEGSTKTVINKILNESPAPPSAHEPTLPPELNDILITALATEPDERYDSPILLREDLAAIAESEREPVSQGEKAETRGQSGLIPDQLSEPTTAKQRKIETITGIGDTYADRLRSVGVSTVRDLAVADPGAIFSATGAGAESIARWIAHARSQAAVDPAWLLDGQTNEPEPVDVLYGIGESYADELTRANVETVADLAIAAPRRVAESSELPVSNVIDWIARARPRAGIATVPEPRERLEDKSETKADDRAAESTGTVNFDVSQPDQVSAIEGIGSVTARELQKAGIADVRELADADVEALAADMGTREQRVKSWVGDARAVAGPPVDAVAGVTDRVSERLVANGIESASQLANCDTSAVANCLVISESDAASLIDRAEETTYARVSDIRGVGPTYAERLRAHGILTPSDLRRTDPKTIGEIAETDIGRAERWQRRARKRDDEA